MTIPKSSRSSTRRRNTSSLLINEQPLQVLPTLAKAIGLNEAMFLQQLHFWTQGHYGKHHDGYVWIYNTYDQWHEQFPFWSVPTIRRIVSTLEKSGLVISSTAYNDHPADRTKWYAVDYGELDALKTSLSESADHVINMISPSDQGEQMDVINPSTSSLRQRKHKEKPMISPPQKKSPIWERLDPDDDRDAVLRNKLERPEVPSLADVEGDHELVGKWMEMQNEWDERYGR